MDKEKLKRIREKLLLGAYIFSTLGARDFATELLNALLKDDKPETTPDLVIPEERRLKRIEELTREITKTRYNWTPEEVKAIKESIIHWRDNVSRLKLASEVGIKITKQSVDPHYWIDAKTGQTIASFSGEDCPLCKLKEGHCIKGKCPLAVARVPCETSNSAWTKCLLAPGNQMIVWSAENMVKVLEGLLE